eukprot:CAMPEP_0168322694 /NCGR_PEP_ID=MMETSP0213-20121227/3043_1 /TAXON_ID=151035 /ORGANISM="Euplotes harpa, Strain FSP1.4" /LENGTH=149 /DNA_ID=CAMNT_0008324633 /DNA_START=229 /DNA_END=678 /DNA_ORIENTATION=-
MEIPRWNLRHNDADFLILHLVSMELNKSDLSRLARNIIFMHPSHSLHAEVVMFPVDLDELNGIHECSLIDSLVLLPLHSSVVGLFGVLILHVHDILVGVVRDEPLEVFSFVLLGLRVEPQLNAVVPVAFQLQNVIEISVFEVKFVDGCV